MLQPAHSDLSFILSVYRMFHCSIKLLFAAVELRANQHYMEEEWRILETDFIDIL